MGLKELLQHLTEHEPRKFHGHAKSGQESRSYNTWKGIKTRCNNIINKDYKNYGARGITYDAKWEKFIGFLEDMGERPEGCTIDRINVDGNYCRENCRWATDKEQRRNRRDSIILEYQGVTKALPDWAIITGLPEETLRSRYKRQWNAGEVLGYEPHVHKNTAGLR